MLSHQSRCRGAFLGHLIGDCLGSPFEGLPAVTHVHLNRYFAQLLDPKLKVPFKPYTGDTAMMKSTARSLISCKTYDPQDMALTIAKEYFKDPKRIYGRGVSEVFMKLRLSGFDDPYGPAKGMYQGLGSFGNAAAMRVLPVPFFFPTLQQVIDTAMSSSKLTHTHRIGYMGAVLHACAIHQIMNSQNSQELVPKEFLKSLANTISEVEKTQTDDEFSSPPKNIKTNTSFVKKLEDIERLLDKQSPGGALVNVEDVVTSLGTADSALGSVSTAIYCFLAAQQEISEIESPSVLIRCLHLAFSFGWNTDTLGCISGALVGAQRGETSIPVVLRAKCEAHAEIEKLADEVCSACESDPKMVPSEKAQRS